MGQVNPPPAGYIPYQEVLPPGWLQNPYGMAYDGALGSLKDFLVSQIKQGILARYAGTAPLDALPSIAADRGVLQGPSETLAQYIPRLQNAWGAWEVAGTAWGILAQLSATGYTTAYVVAANGIVFGPSGTYPNGVLAPDPVNNLPGVPPAVSYAPEAALPQWLCPSGNLYTPGWAIGSNNGQGDPGNPLEGNVNGQLGTPQCFWNRFVVLFGSGTWGSPVNPPTANTVPSLATIQFISTIISDYSAAQAPCLGIAAMTGNGRACYGFPLYQDTTGPTSWASRAGVIGFFTALTYPASVSSWLPHQTVAIPTGYTEVLTVPSAHKLNGYYYYASSGGTSGYVEPTWPTSAGTVSDGSITWHFGGPLQEFSSQTGDVVFSLQT